MFINCQNYAEMLMKNELILYKWEEYTLSLVLILVFVLVESYSLVELYKQLTIIL